MTSRYRMLSIMLAVPAFAQLPDASGFMPNADPVIERARAAAFSFTHTLPDYVVKQFTTRFRTDPAGHDRTLWRQVDLVTADLVYENGRENYTNILVNGKRTKDFEQTGAWSQGEFASSLRTILSPGAEAKFSDKKPDTVVNRPAWRYDYTVGQAHSTWRIQANGEIYQPSYSGAIWIDKETFRVLRIEMAARDMPAEFPLDTVESSVGYDFVTIGNEMFLLPLHSEAVSCIRDLSECTRNMIEFRDYRKYEANTSITFEGTAPK